MNLVADFLERWLALPRATVVIPLHKRVVFVVFSTVPNSPVGFPKSAKPITRSPGFSSVSGAEDWTSGGLLARSTSAVAPECDKGGCEALRSFGISFLVPLIFHYPGGSVSPVDLLVDWSIGVESMAPLIQTAQS
jgi:hypothetical protein